MNRWLVAVLLTGVAWRVWLALPVADAEASLLSFALGVLPYALVATLGRGARARIAATACALGALAVDIATGVAAMSSMSSTGAVAVLLSPLASAVGVAVVLVAWRLLQTVKLRRRV